MAPWQPASGYQDLLVCSLVAIRKAAAVSPPVGTVHIVPTAPIATVVPRAGVPLAVVRALLAQEALQHWESLQFLLLAFHLQLGCLNVSLLLHIQDPRNHQDHESASVIYHLICLVQRETYHRSALTPSRVSAILSNVPVL